MNDDNSNDSPTLPSRIAYSAGEVSDEIHHRNKIGAAWPTSDGGLSLELTTLPVDGKINLQLRDEIQRMKAIRESAHEQFDIQQAREPKL